MVSVDVVRRLFVIFTEVLEESSAVVIWSASPLCWFNNKDFFCVLHIQSNTTIFSPSSTVGSLGGETGGKETTGET